MYMTADNVARKDCPYMCRILDAREEKRRPDNLYVGTVVLVSDQGKDLGYAVTCWHNFDFDFQLKPFEEDRELPGLWLLPHQADIRDCSKRRPVVVVGSWSNPYQNSGCKIQ